MTNSKLSVFFEYLCKYRELQPFWSHMRASLILALLGHYSFTLADTIKKGQLKPLNQSSGNIEIP